MKLVVDLIQQYRPKHSEGNDRTLTTVTRTPNRKYWLRGSGAKPTANKYRRLGKNRK